MPSPNVWISQVLEAEGFSSHLHTMGICLPLVYQHSIVFRRLVGPVGLGRGLSLTGVFFVAGSWHRLYEHGVYNHYYDLVANNGLCEPPFPLRCRRHGIIVSKPCHQHQATKHSPDSYKDPT